MNPGSNLATHRQSTDIDLARSVAAGDHDAFHTLMRRHNQTLYRTARSVLRGVEELNVEETTEVLGIPEATVRTRFFRARHVLREGLAKDIDFALGDAFSFAGDRCDRIVAGVFDRLRQELS